MRRTTQWATLLLVTGLLVGCEYKAPTPYITACNQSDGRNCSVVEVGWSYYGPVVTTYEELVSTHRSYHTETVVNGYHTGGWDTYVDNSPPSPAHSSTSTWSSSDFGGWSSWGSSGADSGGWSGSSSSGGYDGGGYSGGYSSGGSDGGGW